MTDTTPIPAGWYPDPDGGPNMRWWDGGQWTDHRAPQQQRPEDLKAPAGTTTTPTISPFAIFTPGYFAAILLPFLGSVGTIVFSALDFRALSARGVARPFHWAWSFFVLAVQSYGAAIYPIGRTIVARRRGARASWAPMIVAIVVQFIVLVATALWSLQIMSQMFSFLSTLPTVR